MKFLVLMTEPDHFARWAEADQSLRDRVFADFEAFGEAVAARGSIEGGEALDAPGTARTLLPAPPGGGTRAVVEGPYAETVEQLGGFYLIDVPDHATALELAALLPREYRLEVRPVLDVPF